jgi:integrase
LLAAVKKRAPELVAFFGCMYYAALRPEEALHLRIDDIEWPPTAGGWGRLTLWGATVTTNRGWAEDGAPVQDRQLKHRAARSIRPVPAPPPLVALLRDHVSSYGPGPEGRLFVTRRGPGGRYRPNGGAAGVEQRLHAGMEGGTG